MRIFENHFNNNTTYMLGNWCINGKYKFNEYQSDDFFKKINVPEEYKNDILTSFINDEYEDWAQVLNKCKDNCEIKILLANLNKFLDILLHDENWEVRATVANQGYGLDTLINDKTDFVRSAVAKQRYKLDTLVNDKSFIVRGVVAIQKYKLDTLIKDKNWMVRLIVAKQGYGLDILAHDDNEFVREEAKKQIEKINTSVKIN